MSTSASTCKHWIAEENRECGRACSFLVIDRENNVDPWSAAFCDLHGPERRPAAQMFGFSFEVLAGAAS